MDGNREEIFTALANAHMDGIFNYARYMVLDHEEAADIAQKTFLSLYENLSKVQPESAKPWLYRVARNNCLDYFKKKKMTPFSDTENPNDLEIPEFYHSIEE